MSWKNRVKNVAVGDTVQYSADWLRSVGAYTGELPRVKGKVTSITDYGSTKVATIDWGNPEIPERVNVANLTKVKAREKA